MSRNPAEITIKEDVFIREYLKDGNGARAYIAAGYKAKSANVASVGASKMLKKAKIAEKLGALRTKLCDDLEISAAKVLQGIARLAYFDPRGFFRPDGSLKHVTELDDTTAWALNGIDVEKLFKHFGKGQAEEIGTITKLKFADRGLNLERLGRHLKLFTDKVEVSNGDQILEALKAGRARVAARKK